MALNNNIEKNNSDFNFDAIVVGIGHAGIEAAVALAKMGHKTLALSISLDNAGYLACNPSVGGTAKGHLVCEVDALGGQMGIAADKCLTHLKMLNESKGAAVHSLRAQVDKHRYRDYMKALLENQENLVLRQGEVKELLVENGQLIGVETVSRLRYYAKAVVLACGVYLESAVIIGDVIENKGPSGFSRSEYLAKSLTGLGIALRRFKTGTPARIKRSSVDLDCLSNERGEMTNYTFSPLTKKVSFNKNSCYLGYTNLETHKIIKENLLKSPKYAGIIHGAGARYCPSIEDKIVRFADKERHQFFLEPEDTSTQEMYVQGLSTSLPADIQLQIYRSIKGFEKVEIMRDAYAIEYECIDPTSLFPTLMHKDVKGLFFAGQINGTSGYEEAAAQGLVAGINAALLLENKPPLILSRENSYIGVLIDDLVTVGTNEPYRMMTSRAEFRLLLRQDNADLRLSRIGFDVGLADKKRMSLLNKKLKGIKKAKERLNITVPHVKLQKYFEQIGETEPLHSLKLNEIIKRSRVTLENFTENFYYFNDLPKPSVVEVFTELKYEGYLTRERKTQEELIRLFNMPLKSDTDYDSILGLRNEAKEKLKNIRPLNIGQAARISGVTPSDINILIIRLKNK